jgi:hypothetical protein
LCESNYRVAEFGNKFLEDTTKAGNIFVESLKEREKLRVLSIYGRIILKLFDVIQIERIVCAGGKRQTFLIL